MTNKGQTWIGMTNHVTVGPECGIHDQRPAMAPLGPCKHILRHGTSYKGLLILGQPVGCWLGLLPLVVEEVARAA